jgi:hypothetical protein
LLLVVEVQDTFVMPAVVLLQPHQQMAVILILLIQARSKVVLVLEGLLAVVLVEVIQEPEVATAGQVAMDSLVAQVAAVLAGIPEPAVLAAQILAQLALRVVPEPAVEAVAVEAAEL